MKVAICGAWHVHAKDYAKHATELGEIVGVYEENEKLRREFLEKFDVPVFDTLDALLASDAEGVIVCSASCDHADHMVKIANAKKHIFTEKVLALTDEDCDRVDAAVKENGVRFVISLFQKSLAPRRAVKATMDSGELGKINYIRFRNCHSGSTRNWLPSHFYNAKECGGGAMIDLGAHGMYLTHWLLGMPDTFKSTFTLACEDPAVLEKNSDRLEDNAVTVMGYKNGAIAINETGFVSNYSPVVLEVFGETGYVRMTDNAVVKRVSGSGGEIPVELPEKEPLPIVQFLTGDIRDGYGMEEAKALTHMMVKAYE
jgi:predicted dehydrogenase